MYSIAFVASLLAFGNATALEGESSADQTIVEVVPYCTDCVDEFDQQPIDYRVNRGSLSSEFNKRVFSFEEDDNVFNQKTYEGRIEAEAKLMIALEAFKSTIVILSSNIEKLQKGSDAIRKKVLRSSDEIRDMASQLQIDHNYFNQRRDQLLDECALTQHELDDKTDAMILYCQQFAYSPDMARPCVKILDCRQKQLSFKYQFGGNQAPKSGPLSVEKLTAGAQAFPVT